MCVVEPSDIVLQYMVKKQKATKTEIIDEINTICNRLADRGVFTAIDFKYYNNNILSDTIIDNLWYFISSNIIKEHHSEIIYEMTEYGNQISKYLLSSYEEDNSAAWKIATEILSEI